MRKFCKNCGQTNRLSRANCIICGFENFALRFNYLAEHALISPLVLAIETNAEKIALEYKDAEKVTSDGTQIAAFKTSARIIAEHYDELTNAENRVNIEFNSNDIYDGKAANLFVDLAANNNLIVYTGENTHPIFTSEINLKFRAVHDFFGHYHAVSNFEFLGECLSLISHSVKAVLTLDRFNAQNFIGVLICEITAQGKLKDLQGGIFPEQKAVITKTNQFLAALLYERIKDNISIFAALFSHRLNAAQVKRLTANDFQTLDFDGFDLSENKPDDGFVTKAVLKNGYELTDAELELIEITNENGIYSEMESAYIDLGASVGDRLLDEWYEHGEKYDANGKPIF